MAAIRVRRNVRVGWPRSLHRRGGLVGRRSLVRLLAVSLALALLAITAPASSGELTPIPVKTADPPIYLSSPAADGPWFGWTRYDRSTDVSNYYVQRGTKPRLRVNPKGTSADGGGIYHRTVVYAQWRGDGFSPNNLYRFNLRTGGRARFPDPVNSPRKESEPALSGRYLLFKRSFTRPPDDPVWDVSVSRIMLYDRRTGDLRVLARARDGYSDDCHHPGVFVGQVNGKYAVWGHANFSACGLDNDDANVVRLNIRRDTKTPLPRPRHTLQLSPAVSSVGTVYFVRQSKRDGTQQIVKKPVGAQAEILYTVPSNQYAFGLYVDDRANARHVYFTVADSRNRSASIYKLIDPVNPTRAG